MSHHTKAATKRTRNLRKQYKWEGGSQKRRCKWEEGKRICVRKQRGKGYGRGKNVAGIVTTGTLLTGIAKKIISSIN